MPAQHIEDVVVRIPAIPLRIVRGKILASIGMVPDHIDIGNLGFD